MEPFKMYQNVIQHGILIGFWHGTSTKWIPPEDQRRLSDESVEVWHIETFTSLECFSVKLFQWRSVWPQRCNGAMFCCLPLQSEVPCRRRCEFVQTYGGEIHWLRFMLQICGKYESARANQQHWPIISPVFPTTLVEAMWDVWLYDDVSSALKQWYA